MLPCRGRPGGRDDSLRAPAGGSGPVAQRASQPSARPYRAAVRRARSTVQRPRRTPRQVRNAHCSCPMRAIRGDRFVHGRPPTRRLRRSPSSYRLRRANDSRGHSRSRFPPEVGATVSTSALRVSSAKALHARSAYRRKARAAAGHVIASATQGARRRAMLSPAYRMARGVGPSISGVHVEGVGCGDGHICVLRVTQ